MIRPLILAAMSLALAAPAGARAPALRLDRVVLVMRHGVRPPTKAAPTPPGVAVQPWPQWPVGPGELTPHGAAALKLIAASDRAGWRAAGLLPSAGCARIRIIADSDQRTIATGDVYAAAIAGGCPAEIHHQPQGVADPIFSPIEEDAVAYDPDDARQAVLADIGPGGLRAVEAKLRPTLRRLDAILCGAATAGCGVAAQPTTLNPAQSNKRPKFSGALDTGSTVAQSLLLEYADGKPMSEVGWGRATPDDIAAASALHATEFAVLARPRYIARRNAAAIGVIVDRALGGGDAASVTMISGHDTNVAALAGALGLHWQVPGLAADDPSPGGALVFERLVDAGGRRYVRAAYRSQTLDQIRTLDAATKPYRVDLALPGCAARGVAGLCTLKAFRTLMTARLAPLSRAIAPLD